VRFRAADRGELGALLELYEHLHIEDTPLPDRAAVCAVWESILADPKVHCLVAEAGGTLVSSCMLAIIPNLTRGARPYGHIENVVTHADYRKRGIGTRLLQHALQVAWDTGCYKVMLSTSRKDEAVMRFYEGAGFRRGVKTGFVATPE